jgi:hypothetical protein
LGEHLLERFESRLGLERRAAGDALVQHRTEGVDVRGRAEGVLVAPGLARGHVGTMTLGGVVELYLLFFIHIGSRRVIVSRPTANPDAAWVAQQARNASMQMAEWGLTASRLIRDGDRKFQEGFDAVFEAQGTEVQRVGPRAPNMKEYVSYYTSCR